LVSRCVSPSDQNKNPKNYLITKEKKMKKQWFLVTMLSVFVASLVFTSLALAPVAQAKGTDIRIALKGSGQFPNAKGTAKYRDRGGEREFQVEVENVKALAGKTLSVFANGKKVGSLKINSLGAGSLNLNSARGNSVPAIGAGSKVQVKTGAGVRVVSGQF
jgi:hypothetical protein